MYIIMAGDRNHVQDELPLNINELTKGQRYSFYKSDGKVIIGTVLSKTRGQTGWMVEVKDVIINRNHQKGTYSFLLNHLVGITRRDLARDASGRRKLRRRRTKKRKKRRRKKRRRKTRRKTKGRKKQKGGE